MNEILEDETPIVDLMAELSKPAQNVDTTVMELSNEQVRQQYNPSDFESEVFTTDNETLTDSEESPGVVPAEPAKDSHFYKREAKRLTRLLDKGLKMGVPPLYKSLVLEPDDAVKLRKYRTRMTVQKEQGITEMVSNDDDILSVLERYDRLNEMINGIALTDDETEDLVTDLSEVLKLRQKSFFSPETSLLLTVLVIVFSRVEPVISSKFKKLFK